MTMLRIDRGVIEMTSLKEFMENPENHREPEPQTNLSKLQAARKLLDEIMQEKGSCFSCRDYCSCSLMDALETMEQDL